MGHVPVKPEAVEHGRIAEWLPPDHPVDGCCDVCEDGEEQVNLREDRGAYYGPVATNHISIGMIWGGILTQAVQADKWIPGQPLPARLVTLMMTGVKMSREAFRHKQDNVDDAKVYWDFTKELSE
jgi:hypothetical protein